jgi:hypothetical protein
VNSHLTEDFVERFRQLPRRIQDLARKNYRLWKRDAELRKGRQQLQAELAARLHVNQKDTP